MNDNKIKSSKILLPVGTSSLITVFIVLCIAIFTTITMITAIHEEKLTDQTYDHLNHYYTAQKDANVFVAQIQDAVMESKGNEDSLNSALSALDFDKYNGQYSLSQENGKTVVTVNFSVPINENMNLEVEADNSTDPENIKIRELHAKAIDSGMVLDDEYLDLYEGDN